MTTSIAPLETLGRVHFIGIGGVGMSAVARIMVARGVPVSGSDAKDLPVMQDLAAAGARIAVGYDAANLGDAQTVVAGSAIRADNPELVAARSGGLAVLHRSEGLASTMAGHRVVTVAGTHGKSTTTSMVAVLLKEAGLDPSFAIGANVPALGVNAAHGSSDIFVAEADESDGSFLNYQPLISVVTNVEADHLDHYGTPEAVFASFDAFAALLPADGVLLACADDPGALALAQRTAAKESTRVLTYGTSPEADIRLHDGGPGEVSVGVGNDVHRLDLKVPGRHNALNAAAAFAVALELGVAPAAAAAALGHFTGASRRFELKGQGRGVRRLRTPPYGGPGCPVGCPFSSRRTQSPRSFPAAPLLADPGIRRGVCLGAGGGGHCAGPGYLSRARGPHSRRDQFPDLRPVVEWAPGDRCRGC